MSPLPSMTLLEGSARSLLLFHAVAAGLLVAVTTHHAVWAFGYLRGDYRRARGERRFAWLAASAYVGTFVLGALLYPTYRVRVRAELFDTPESVEEERQLRGRARERAALAGAREASRSDGDAPGLERSERAPRGEGLAWVGRLFDVKEHWVALGLLCSLGLVALSRRAHPSVLPEVRPLYLLLIALSCGTAWVGLVVGLYVSAVRSVGGLP